MLIYFLGHVFNAPHDNVKACQDVFGKLKNDHMMSPTLIQVLIYHFCQGLSRAQLVPASSLNSSFTPPQDSMKVWVPHLPFQTGVWCDLIRKIIMILFVHVHCKIKRQ